MARIPGPVHDDAVLHLLMHLSHNRSAGYAFASFLHTQFSLGERCLMCRLIVGVRSQEIGLTPV